MQSFDVVVVGAGAAGLFCAGIAGQRGLRVLLLDHADKLAEKIRISGGGRCNFTNRDVGPANFLSGNPHFCRSALARYTPADFIALVQRHGIAFHEKHRGQLFCDGSAEQIIRMLVDECSAGQVERWQPCSVAAVRHGAAGFELDTQRGTVQAPRLVVATGGLPVPKIGASDWGLRLARQFGHQVVEPRPALVPLTFDAAAWAPFTALAGLSLEVAIEAIEGAEAAEAAEGGNAVHGVDGVEGQAAKPGQSAKSGKSRKSGKSGKSASSGRFVEDLLFTHRGLSGPAVLQVSSYWQPGKPLRISLANAVADPLVNVPGHVPRQAPSHVPSHAPGHAALADALRQAKGRSQRHLGNELALHLPERLAQTWLRLHDLPAERPMPDVRDRDLARLVDGLARWQVQPTGTEGWRKAEVMAGGVDTRELESQSLASKRVPGLHFIGEVVDVTGWLGGYNFQWAWASAAACARLL